MAAERLDRLTIALLLSVYATRGKEPAATVAAIRNSLADVIAPKAGVSVNEEVDARIAAAVATGLIASVQSSAKRSVRRYALTDAGLAQLARNLPRPLKRGTWASLRDGTLIACTLPPALAERNLPFGHLRAIVIAEGLGYEDRISHAKTENAVLNLMAAGTLEARNASPSTIRLARLRRWIASDEATPSEEALSEKKPGGGAHANGSSPSLQEFATAVRAAAARAEGRFGRKAFISRVWQALAGESAFHGLDFAEFRKRLVDANRQGLLRLSRADLVDALPANDVRESAVRVLDDDVHFVEVER